LNKPSAPTLIDLFLGFAKIGILGFGGVVAIARHIIVEERQWLNDEEYASVLAIGQVLPGANTINAGVMIGDRFQGKLGSLVCVLGIMTIPAIVVVVLAIAYNQFASIPQIHIALIGASAAAAGMILGTGFKLLSRIKSQISDYLIVALAITCISIFHFPLVTTLVALIPLSFVIAWGVKK
jgi:chromate transporter